MVHFEWASTGAALVLLGGILWAVFRAKRWLRRKVCHV